MGGPAWTGRKPVSSKSRSRFQSLSRRIGGMAGLLGLAVVVGASATMPDGRPTPTGLEVPRWLTLKSSEVRARTGPGLDYSILWEYRAAGLPVQVIAETREWRKICDPEGSVAWVHRSVVSARRGAFNASVEEVPIRTGRSEDAAVKARFSPRSVIALDDCKDGWCEVRARKLKGWVAEDSIFGAGNRALCDASRQAGEAD